MLGEAVSQNPKGDGVPLLRLVNEHGLAGGEQTQLQDTSQLPAYSLDVSNRTRSAVESRGELPRVIARNYLVDSLGPTMKQWESEFRQKMGWDAQLVLEGSMRVGNFRGAKPSLNPEKHGALVIDVDLGLRLPDEVDLTDPATISAIEQITNSKHWDNFLWDYWGVDLPAGVYFAYVEVPELIALVGTAQVELEFTVRQKGGGTVAFSDYWEQIFTPDEVLHQIEEKSQAAKLDDEAAYLAVKAQHNADARYRIMFGWHRGVLSGMPPGLNSLLPSWFTWATRPLDGAMPRPPTDKSSPWLRECWEKAQRINALYRRTSGSGEPINHKQ